MSIFAVEYVYNPDHDHIRAEHRPAHREWLEALVGDGVGLGAAHRDAGVRAVRSDQEELQVEAGLAAVVPVFVPRAVGDPAENLQAGFGGGAALPHQFDAWVWFDRSTALTPTRHGGDADPGVKADPEDAETFPTGL